MRTYCQWAVALVIPVVWAAAARAQEEFIPRETTVKLILLRHKSVQKELELSDEVTRKVMDFTTAQSVTAGKALKLDADKRKEAFDQLEEQNKKFLADNLNEKQNKRLHQITLQMTALEQLTRPEAVRELKLTEEQQEKIKELRKETRKELMEILKAGPGQGKKERLHKLRHQTRDKILALLTDEQKKLVREKAGDPFNGELEFEEHEEDKDK